jgi:hypothetical protein
MRTLITGGPETGKTTLGMRLAAERGCRHLCTDPQDLCPAGVAGAPLDLSWSENSLWVAQHWLYLPGPWVIEGVAVPRALRKWQSLEREGAPPPCDELIILTTPHTELGAKQEQMTAALLSVVEDLMWWIAPVTRWM